MWKSCAAMALAVAALVWGCTPQETQQASPPSPSTSVTATTPPATTTTTPAPPPFYPHIYESNFDRQAAINVVTREFGLLVMQEAKKGKSNWGGFDTFCTAKGETDGRWTSRKHKPQVGEMCTTQHTPDYSWPPIQISATYEVLPGGRQEFTRAYVSSPACYVQTEHYLHGDVRGVSTTKTIIGSNSTEMTFESTSTAKSVAGARHADEQVIACLKSTRP